MYTSEQPNGDEISNDNLGNNNSMPFFNLNCYTVEIESCHVDGMENGELILPTIPVSGESSSMAPIVHVNPCGSLKEVSRQYNQGCANVLSIQRNPFHVNLIRDKFSHLKEQGFLYPQSYDSGVAPIVLVS